MSAPLTLGSRVRDQVSGFVGIAIGRAVYLFEVPQILVAPEGVKDGKPAESHWMPESRLVEDAGRQAPGFVSMLETPTPGQDMTGVFFPWAAKGPKS